MSLSSAIYRRKEREDKQKKEGMSSVELWARDGGGAVSPRAEAAVPGGGPAR